MSKKEKIQKDILVIKSKMQHNENIMMYLRKINIDLFSEFIKLTDELGDISKEETKQQFYIVIVQVWQKSHQKLGM